MREFYELDDLYPERHKLKEKGVDIEEWYSELFDEEGNFALLGPLAVDGRAVSPPWHGDSRLD